MASHNQARTKNFVACLDRLGVSVVSYIVRAYQYLLSPWIGQHCRFTPSCSHYALEALHTHGTIKGCWLTTCRLCRCHPWHSGGEDPVPPRKNDCP